MKSGKAGYLRGALIAAYIVILFCERAQSIARVIASGGFFATAFDSFVDILAVLSLASSLFLAAFFTARRMKSPGRAYDLSGASVVCGVLLLSGMVHTGYTVPVIQFVAYGALILAMCVHTAAFRPIKRRKTSFSSGIRFFI